MPKKSSKSSLASLPEVFLSSSEITDLVSRARKKGQIRKLASRLYSKNLTDSPQEVISRNIWPIVALYFPGAVLVDRTALESAPATDGSIFVVSDKKHAVTLPGYEIRPRKGKPALPSDRGFVSGLTLSSPARAFLENMRPSRARGERVTRTLSRKEIEEHLEQYLRRTDKEQFNKLRDDARRIASELDLEEESKELDALIGSLLGTREEPLTSAIAISRAAGVPYDPKRFEKFETLRYALEHAHVPTRKSQSPSSALIFFEAYFSNFIEGTEFEVDEAKEIIFQSKIPTARPEDAHDVRGTFDAIYEELGSSPVKNAKQFLNKLKSVHKQIMGARVDKLPGEFKRKQNRVGGTIFVAPELVEGSLTKLYELSQSLTAPFARALFLMFGVSEVHPFVDGNGRVARIVMNSELSSANQTRIIIPTVFRNNYLSGLRAVTHNDEAPALIKTLDFAQRYTHALDWSDINRAQRTLEETNAFMNPNEADDKGVRLEIPEVS